MDWTHFALAIGGSVAGWFLKHYMRPQTHSILDDLFAERAKLKAKQELQEAFAPAGAKEGTKVA